jgi:uncharacterized protein YfaT (DUF1175 family)
MKTKLVLSLNRRRKSLYEKSAWSALKQDAMLSLQSMATCKSGGALNAIRSGIFRTWTVRTSQGRFRTSGQLPEPV